jgi:single-strand DNA-binding protein
MNSVNVIGRLTKDPELRKLDEGRSLCTFTLAVDDIHSKEGRADFLRVSVFGNPGDLCERYLRKGFWAGVTGRLRTDTYTDAEGVVRYPVKVIAENVRFLQWPEREDADGARQEARDKRRPAKDS